MAMADAQQFELQILDEERTEEKLVEVNLNSESTNPKKRNYNWWFKIFVYVAFILIGQSAALLLGRLYFVKGGNSQWMATLVQVVGFPVLIPFYLFIQLQKPNPNPNYPSLLTRSAVYAGFGLLFGADSYLYSVGLQYLPVSTYTLICASQLAFNSLFSFFLNNQNFTPFVINSLVLLTISSVLLVFDNESSSGNSVSKVKYIIGFICTVGASAGYGLVLSLTQLWFAKRQTFKVVMDLIMYQEVVASAAILVGLFASGEWSGLGEEMGEFQLGKVGYVMNIVWTAICWQVFSIGSVGLIFEVTSLFSNAIGVLGLPIVPIVAVFVFSDKMGGVKVISLVLALWGFLSYLYQQYLDDCQLKAPIPTATQISKVNVRDES